MHFLLDVGINYMKCLAYLFLFSGLPNSVQHHVEVYHSEEEQGELRLVILATYYIADVTNIACLYFGILTCSIEMPFAPRCNFHEGE